MKKFFSLILTILFVIPAFAQRNDIICRLGIVYEISKDVNWGFNKHVVLGVIPYTSAELSGIRRNDIIESSVGIPTDSLSPKQIRILLNPVGGRTIKLTVSNLTLKSRELLVRKECKRRNSISESVLASAFSFYSLENTSVRSFVCPFKTQQTKDTVDFTVYRTYSFVSKEDTEAEVDKNIYGVLEKELDRYGLERNNEKPDMLVLAYYYSEENPNYKEAYIESEARNTKYCFDYYRSRMDKFPFCSTADSTNALYILKYGFRFIDQRIKPGRVLWECEAKEYLSEPYPLDEYARVFTPLMFRQYPYVRYKENVPFKISFKNYNYTGIHYDVKQMNRVMSVDENSPAAIAGIKSNDIIKMIDQKEMIASANEYVSAYHAFIKETMNYRDKSTMFTDANGFDKCMFWDINHYSEITEAFSRPEYLGTFSYLYKFAPYVTPPGNNMCTFLVERDGAAFEVNVRPIVRNHVMIELK